MTFLSKTTAALSLTSAITDIHKTGKIYANNAYAKTMGQTYIDKSVGYQKSDTLSTKDAQRKNWLLKNNFFSGIKETASRIAGYFKGVGNAALRYIPNFVLGGVAMLSKTPKWANFGAIGLAVVEVWDFIRNSTNLFQKNDYLK